MKQSEKTMKIILFCCVGLLLSATEAYAAGVQSDVLDLVRDKAADFIRNLRPLIFILAGFGLIGFAFGAIFGKISWKWFANIAIGLFLVANVGLFVDYFASKDGTRSIYREALGYGRYLDASGSYTATSGSQTDPKKQSSASQDGANEENSNSEDVGTECAPGTGVGCADETGKKETINNKEECQAKGGTWIDTECVIPEEETPDEAPLPGTGFEQQEADCKSKGGTWIGTECVIPEEETPDEAPLPGTGFEQQAEACQASGGYWINNGCVTIPEEETPDEAPLPGTGFEQQEAACKSKGGTWIGTECVIPEEETPDESPLPGTGFENVYDADGGELGEVVVTAKDYSKEKQACQLKGGTWNSSTLSCQEKAFDSGLSGITSSSQQANASVVDNASSQANTATTENSSSINNNASDNSNIDNSLNQNSNDTEQKNTEITDRSDCVKNKGYWSEGKCVISQAGIDLSGAYEVYESRGQFLAVDKNGRTINLTTGEDVSMAGMDLVDEQGTTWLYDFKKDVYRNPETGEAISQMELRSRGSVYSVTTLKKKCEAQAGHIWVGNELTGKCLSEAEVTTETGTAQQDIEKLKSQYQKEYNKTAEAYRKTYNEAMQQCQKTRTSCQEAIMNDESLSGNEKINKINNTCVIEQSQCQQKAITERNQNIKKAKEEYQNKIASLTQ